MSYSMNYTTISNSPARPYPTFIIDGSNDNHKTILIKDVMINTSFNNVTRNNNSLSWLYKLSSDDVKKYIKNPLTGKDIYIISTLYVEPGQYHNVEELCEAINTAMNKAFTKLVTVVFYYITTVTGYKYYGYVMINDQITTISIFKTNVDISKAGMGVDVFVGDRKKYLNSGILKDFTVEWPYTISSTSYDENNVKSYLFNCDEPTGMYPYPYNIVKSYTYNGTNVSLSNYGKIENIKPDSISKLYLHVTDDTLTLVGQGIADDNYKIYPDCTKQFNGTLSNSLLNVIWPKYIIMTISNTVSDNPFSRLTTGEYVIVSGEISFRDNSNHRVDKIDIKVQRITGLNIGNTLKTDESLYIYILCNSTYTHEMSYQLGIICDSHLMKFDNGTINDRPFGESLITDDSTHVEEITETKYQSSNNLNNASHIISVIDKLNENKPLVTYDKVNRTITIPFKLLPVTLNYNNISVNQLLSDDAVNIGLELYTTMIHKYDGDILQPCKLLPSLMYNTHDEQITSIWEVLGVHATPITINQQNVPILEYESNIIPSYSVDGIRYTELLYMSDVYSDVTYYDNDIIYDSVNINEVLQIDEVMYLVGTNITKSKLGDKLFTCNLKMIDPISFPIETDIVINMTYNDITHHLITFDIQSVFTTIPVNVPIRIPVNRTVMKNDRMIITVQGGHYKYSLRNTKSYLTYRFN